MTDHNNPDNYDEGTKVQFVQSSGEHHQVNEGTVRRVVEDGQGKPAVQVLWDDDKVTTTQIEKNELTILEDNDA